jgi:choline dehydrogenase-like flavoprotein
MDHTAALGVMVEDLPEPHNRVTLDPEMTDSDGIPAPKISYTVSENSRSMQDHGIARGTELMQAAGAREVLVNPLLGASGWHLMGTARMGTHDSDSVVDQWGKCHDVKNLYVIDGSIWTTCGAVNPTSTIQALALYVADHIKTNARHLLD